MTSNMKRQLKILLLVIWIVPLIGIAGCGEEKAAKKPSKSVSKKIAVQPQPSKTAPVEPLSGNMSSSQQDKKAANVTAADTNATETSDLVRASLQIASGYDPVGRFDPFEPLFKDQPQEEQAVTTGNKKPRRVPRTPLERVALSQLKLTAIIRAPSGNRALVADATGKGYVVRTGTYIGLNSGQVVAIKKDRILIEEEVENLTGELTIKNAELKLQKPAGEL